MKKVILNFRGLHSREAIHEYIAQQMGFPHYYGRNLDALFDCLTDIDQPTTVGCYFPEEETVWDEEELDAARRNRLKDYLERLQETFLDAEEENRNLAVFFGHQLD